MSRLFVVPYNQVLAKLLKTLYDEIIIPMELAECHKTRKPGGGRKKLKPEYDAGKNLKEQMDAAVALYEEDCSLQSIADALALNPIKVRKLLITAGMYESEVAEKVKNTFEEWKHEQGRIYQAERCLQSAGR